MTRNASATTKLQRDRVGRRNRRGERSYVLVTAKDQPWRHGPAWTLPAGKPAKGYEDRARAYAEALASYRVWIHEELRQNPRFLDALRGRCLACPCDAGVRCPTTILLEQLAAADR